MWSLRACPVRRKCPTSCLVPVVCCQRPRSAVLIETSTIGPGLSRRISSELMLREICYLDAPVSGGARGARDGTLVAMVGGAGDTLERVRPIISCFAGSIFHLGPVGAGNTVKLVIQSIFLTQMASLLESVSLGERCGNPLELLLDVVDGRFLSPSPRNRHPVQKLKCADLTPLFEIGSAVKNMSLAEELWSTLEMISPTLAPALSEYRSAAAGGYAGADLIAVHDWLNRGTSREEK